MALDEIREGLKLIFGATAEWRRLRAEECPEDRRNLEAAAIFDRLAQTVDEVDAAFLDAYGSLWDDFRDSHQHAEMLRQVGFHSWPQTAEDFVKEYVANRSGTA